MKNSYAGVSGAFPSTILGTATTLFRCGIQANIVSASVPHAVWSENGGAVSRVEVYVVPGLAPGDWTPLPAFGRTYSGTMTRGLYCQAPTPFTVVGLRVPDESRHGRQNVCLYRDASAPPAYPSTAPLTPVFSKFGEPSANIIPCLVPFQKGEWMIALGACGDATRLYNSYGGSPGCFQSSILGQPTSICRAGLQANLVTAPTPHAIWSENAFEVSRVEIFVSPAGIQGSGSGAIGSLMTFLLAAPGNGGRVYQVASSFGDGPIWIDTRLLALSPDSLLILSAMNVAPSLFVRYAGLFDATGLGKAGLNIPNIPSLKGMTIYTAFVALYPRAPSGVSAISNTFGFQVR